MSHVNGSSFFDLFVHVRTRTVDREPLLMDNVIGLEK